MLQYTFPCSQHKIILCYFILGANFLEQVFWTTGYEYFEINISNLPLKICKIITTPSSIGKHKLSHTSTSIRKLTFTSLREKVSFVVVFIYLIMKEIGHILYFISHLFLFSVINYSLTIHNSVINF